MAENIAIQGLTVKLKEKEQEIETLKKVHQQEIIDAANEIKHIIGQIKRLYNNRIRNLEQELKQKDEALSDIRERLENFHETHTEMTEKVKNALTTHNESTKNKKAPFFKKFFH